MGAVSPPPQQKNEHEWVRRIEQDKAEWVRRVFGSETKAYQWMKTRLEEVKKRWRN